MAQCVCAETAKPSPLSGEYGRQQKPCVQTIQEHSVRSRGVSCAKEEKGWVVYSFIMVQNAHRYMLCNIDRLSAVYVEGTMRFCKHRNPMLMAICSTSFRQSSTENSSSAMSAQW
mmetsp:Transcript_9295/g.32811  ORF Transcript_9295/g.32811 Transcript_9295/m.32811 type:complete len:115 (-) Transcript_9295:675-1019(-)